MIRAAAISAEIQARKIRNGFRLLNGVLSVCLCFFVWARLAQLIDWSWLAVCSPAIVVGVGFLVMDALVCLKAAWMGGCYLVRRSDLRARKSFTIRNGR